MKIDPREAQRILLEIVRGGNFKMIVSNNFYEANYRFVKQVQNGAVVEIDDDFFEEMGAYLGMSGIDFGCIFINYGQFSEEIKNWVNKCCFTKKEN